jgi:hypothetical protein
MATEDLKFKAGMDDSNFSRGLRKMEDGAVKTSGKITNAFKGIGGMMAGAFAVGTVIAATKAVIDFNGQLQDSAEGIGMTTTRMQELRGAFMNSGVSSEKFEKGMGKLSQAIQDAKDNTGTSRKAFDALGMSWEDLDGKSTDEVLMRVADAMKNATDPTKAFAAASDLLGKGQIKMVGALKQGSAALDEQSSKITIIGEQSVKDIASIGDALDQLGLKAMAVGSGALLGLKGTLDQTARSMAIWAGITDRSGMAAEAPTGGSGPAKGPRIVKPATADPRLASAVRSVYVPVILNELSIKVHGPALPVVER